MSDECEHGEVEPGLCPPCQSAAGVPGARASRDVAEWGEGRFSAGYPGRCHERPDPIEVGDLIRLGERGDRRVYAHDDCVGAEAA